jgi:hypothetical protein
MRYDIERMRSQRQKSIDTRKESVKQRDMSRKRARLRKYSIVSLQK